MKLHEAARAFEDLEDEGRVCAMLFDKGFTRFAVPPAGADVNVAELCRAREALAYRSAMADSVLAVLGLGCFAVSRAGTAEQQARYLDPVRQGQAACGFALTEPEAGSDVASMQARAVRDGDHFVVDGHKTFISNVGIARWFTLFCQSDDGPLALVVETSDPGVQCLQDIPLSAPHPIGSIRLARAKIPRDRLIGETGQGIKLAFGTLDTFRVSVAAAACGMAQRALDDTIERVKSRTQFGKRLADFQLTQARLADAATDLEASRGLVRRAIDALEASDPAAKKYVSMAKLFATEAAQRVIDGAVQLHGGQGVVRGNRVEALYREVRALRIYEGTSEIQKLIIARALIR